MVQKKSHSGLKIGAGALAGVLAGAAAGYFLYGTAKGRKVRADAKVLAQRIKGEVVREAKRLKHMGKKDYLRIVDMVAKKHRALKGVSATQVAEVANELKRHWGAIEKKTRAVVKKGVRTASRRKKTYK